MIDSRIPAARATGVDLGASLIKVATLSPEGAVHFRRLPRAEAEDLGESLRDRATCIGATGAGATPWLERFAPQGTSVREFEAWWVGGELLLETKGGVPAPPYLLVSLGTGTSAMRVDAGGVERVGGCALGGGTISGLAARLLDCRDFAGLVELSRGGNRGGVDLRVGDIYGDRGIEMIGLPGEVTAANLGKLGGGDEGRQDAADIARGIMGLVGENVALIASHLATHHRVSEIVFAGSPLSGNQPLGEIVLRVAAASGHPARILDGGEFAGAVGALCRAYPAARAALSVSLEGP
ncbi:MAG: hypothetical protein HKP27_16645 [Myxococcales bacterium]|nr:hypothetical protein [Myxococcales bacterium]